VAAGARSPYSSSLAKGWRARSEKLGVEATGPPIAKTRVRSIKQFNLHADDPVVGPQPQAPLTLILSYETITAIKEIIW
jgi:hypothetical protein